jgi:glycogen phosphorylase
MTFDLSIDAQAEMLLAKTKHYLITMMGRSSDNAHPDELYRALSYALREEIMINWGAASSTFTKQDVRMLYYFSMEYMPGRVMSNNISNISSSEIVKAVLQKLNRGFDEIVYLEDDPGLGNGGLGRLASCFLDSLATIKYPAQGYGLRYQYGIFEQQVWDGVQIEAPDTWLLTEYPWEFRRDQRKVTVEYCGETLPGKNIHGDEILEIKNFEQVWALPYDIPIIGYAKDHNFSVVTLRLWSTKESPRNFLLQRYNAGRLDQAAENTTLTDVLYPSDNHELGKRIRLKQEYLLVSASLQDIIRHYLTKHENFREFADKIRIQINDTHPSLIIAELIRILIQNHDIPWNMAVEMTRTITGYTNHTILSEALEQWEVPLIQYLLPRQMKIIERLNYEFCSKLREKYPSDEAKVKRMSIIEEGKVRMAHLAIVGSHKINGVAALHSEILKHDVFKDFYELNPSEFINITNGVTPRRWLLMANPELANFITKRIGDKWITDFLEIKKLAPFADDPVSRQEFLVIKKKNKLRLIDFLNRNNKLRNASGIISSPSPILDSTSLFDMQIKRLHEYKRQLMNALHLIILYFEIQGNPHHGRVKRTSIIAGKAAAGYETAKNVIRLINCLERKINSDPVVSKFLKVVYVENYNVSRAEVIIPAADLSEQISTAGTEASGTGNMKLAINGALTIGTNDGANIEMREEITDQYWPFAFGASAEEIQRLRSTGGYDPRATAAGNPKIQKALDSLINGTFTKSDDEHNALVDLYNKLMVSHYGGAPDRYFTIYDLQSYYDAQKKVEEYFKDEEKWASLAIHQVAGMGKFSSDTSIRNYSDLVWQLQPCPADPDILDRYRDEFSKIDRCRIF